MTSPIAVDAAEGEAQAIRVMSARWLAAVDARDPKRAAAFCADDGAFLVPNAPAAQGRESVGRAGGSH